MPTVYTPNVARVEVRAEQDGVLMENVIYFEAEAPFDQSSLEVLAAAVRDGWDLNVSPLQSQDLTVHTIVAVAMDFEGAPGIELPVSLVGTDNTGGMPTNVTITMKLSGGLTGRSFRGRLYHMGLPSQAVLNSKVTGAWHALLLDGYTDFLSYVNINADAAWVVVSTVHNGTPRITGVTTPITAVLLADDNLDSQRRRLPGRGN